MKRRENWAERFERKQEEKEEMAENILKSRQLEKYNEAIRKLKEEYAEIRDNDYNAQIEILERMLEIYCDIKNLSIDGINVEKEIKKLEENINYLKFRVQYLEEYDVTEFSIEKVRRQAEIDEMYYEEKLCDLKEEKSRQNSLLRLKKIADRSKESQSWEEYKKEEEEKER